jgi:hypothetical protein
MNEHKKQVIDSRSLPGSLTLCPRGAISEMACAPSAQGLELKAISSVLSPSLKVSMGP